MQAALLIVLVVLALALRAHAAPLRPVSLFESARLLSAHDGSHPHAPQLSAPKLAFDRTVHRVSVSSNLFARSDAELIGLRINLLDQLASSAADHRLAALAADTVPQVYGVVEFVTRLDDGSISIGGKTHAMQGAGDQGTCRSGGLLFTHISLIIRAHGRQLCPGAARRRTTYWLC